MVLCQIFWTVFCIYIKYIGVLQLKLLKSSSMRINLCILLLFYMQIKKQKRYPQLAVTLIKINWLEVLNNVLF